MAHARLDQLFDAASAIAPEQRAAWLDSACGDDVELRGKLERLIAADARAEGILESGPALIAGVMLEQATPPQAFGVWRVLRPLGTGGMGAVWLAERDDAGYTQRAAIKQVAYPTPGLLQRFAREREILARLEHPGIARLIDGGVDAEGCPYLAMEHVEGARIDDWASGQGLNVRRTIRLLLKVCDAVQFAHRNLVVHSDLKPSNILVDADGGPRLLDFGIARVLSEEVADGTHTATRLMTPDYAAPEWLAGGAPTTAVDVYALGVLAYQLLCGHKPYRLHHGHDTAQQLADTTVPPPSAAVTADLPDPRSRRRALQGDLDRVVMSAMAAEPTRRYATVEALATDLRNWLDGRAVAARGDNTWYRMRKFVGRNRAAVGIAAAAVLALLAATAFSLHQAREATRQAARAETVTRFLTDMFRFADPKGVPGGLQLTARQMLDAGARRYDRELHDQPALAAKFATTLGTIYTELGEYDRAISLANDALKQHNIARSDRAHAFVVLARAQFEKGDYAAAQTSIDRAKLLHAAENGTPSASVAADIALAGEVARRQGDFQRSEQLALKALAMSRATLNAPHAQIASELNQLAVLYGDMRRVEEARAPTEQALAMYRKLYGENHLDVAENIANLGTIDMQTDRLDEALQQFQLAEAIYRRLLPVDHPILAAILVNEARALQRAGRYLESQTRYDDALAMQRKLLGDDHPDVAATLNNMAALAFQLGDVHTAADHFRSALEIWKRQGKPDHPLAQVTRIHLASVLRELGDSAQAESLLRAARGMAMKTIGDSHPITLLAGVELGITLHRAGKLAEALAVERDVDAILATSKAVPALFKAKAGMHYALTELDAGNVAAARTRIKTSSDVFAALESVDPLSRGQLLLAQARIAIAAGDADAGCAAAAEAVTLAQSTFGDNNVHTVKAREVASSPACSH